MDVLDFSMIMTWDFISLKTRVSSYFFYELFKIVLYSCGCFLLLYGTFLITLYATLIFIKSAIALKVKTVPVHYEAEKKFKVYKTG